MQFRNLGKLGIRVSALGYGAMRLPAKEDGSVDLERSLPLLRLGIDQGINYLDTAHGYLNGTSEVAIGQAIKGYDRGKLYISTKVPPNEKSGTQWRQEFDESLRRLDTDYVDFIHLHSLRLQSYQDWVDVPGGSLAEVHKIKELGLARHIAFSCHDTSANLMRLIDTGEFDLVTLQYNLLDRQHEEAIHYAHEKGLGVVVMGPVGGGRLGFPSDNLQKLVPGGVKSTPEIAIRFVLAHPGVSLALSGMNAREQILENTATASREEPLSQTELRLIREALKENEKLAQLYCTGCNYCMPCPNGVNIPENFRLMNYARVYGLREMARTRYQKLTQKNESAASCVECGECEPKCPQLIKIREQLSDVESLLG